MLAQDAVDRGLIFRAPRLEPGHHIRVEPHRHQLLSRPVELADFGFAPVHDLGNIRRIDIGIVALRQRGQFGRLPSVRPDSDCARLSSLCGPR